MCTQDFQVPSRWACQVTHLEIFLSKSGRRSMGYVSHDFIFRIHEELTLLNLLIGSVSAAHLISRFQNLFGR